MRRQQDCRPQCKLLRAPVLLLGPFRCGITWHARLLLWQGQVASLAGNHSRHVGIAPGIRDEACKVTGPPRRPSHAHAAAGLCKGLGGQDAPRTTERISGPAAHVRLATHALRAAALQAGAGGAWLRCEARLYRHVGHSAATVLMRHSTTCFVSHGVTSGEIYLLTGAVSVTCVFRPRPVDLDVTVRLRTQ